MKKYDIALLVIVVVKTFDLWVYDLCMLLINFYILVHSAFYILNKEKRFWSVYHFYNIKNEFSNILNLYKMKHSLFLQNDNYFLRSFHVYRWKNMVSKRFVYGKWKNNQKLLAHFSNTPPPLHMNAHPPHTFTC